MSISCLLYRQLLRKATQFDKYPGLKAAFPIPDEWQRMLGFGLLHNPCIQDAEWKKLVRKAFRDSNGSVQQGFAALKLLTEVETSLFQPIYGSLKLLPAAESKGPIVAQTQPDSKKWATALKISPVALPNPTRPSKKSLALQHTSRRTISQLQEGTILLAHPLLRDPPYRKAVLLVLKIRGDFVDLVLLNDTQFSDARYCVEKGNFFFPPELHGQPVCFGGHTILRSFPPHSNVHLLHNHSDLPNAKAIVKDEDGILFASGPADLPLIGGLVRAGTPASDFRIIFGTFEEPVGRVLAWLQSGYFVAGHISSRSLTQLQVQHPGAAMWDTVLQELGGDFAHMRLTSQAFLA